jgi:hypothetical protein
VYDNPYDIYLQLTGDMKFESVAGGGSGADRLDLNMDAADPNDPGLVVCIDWTDIETIKFIINGGILSKLRHKLPHTNALAELVRVRHVKYSAVYDSSLYSGSPPPANLIGQIVPMFIMISHQFGVNFNPIDLAALQANTKPISESYDVQSIRVWNKPTTMEPPSK